MPFRMNRRHWLRSVFGLVAGFWAARGAPAGPPPRARGVVTSYDLTPPGPGCCQVVTYTYDARNRLRCIADGPVTTYVYDGPGSIPYNG